MAGPRTEAYSRWRYTVSDRKGIVSDIVTVSHEGYTQRLDELGQRIGVTPGPLDTAAQREIARLAAESAVSIVRTHNDDLKAFIDRLPKDADVPAEVQAWEQNRADWKGRQVAYNATMQTRNAADQRFRRENDVQVRMSVTPEDAVCPECQDIVDMGEMSQDDADSIDLPVHVNCVVSGTLVTPIGRLHAASSAAYNGPLYRIRTHRGAELSITPNHPVLTARGWVAAQFVQKGDQLFHKLVVNSLRGNFDDVPARIEDVFSALWQRGQRRRRIASASDFHGDGRFMQGDVNAVFADCFLPREVNTARRKQLAQSNLMGAGVGSQSFSRCRACEQFSMGSFDAAHGGMSGIDVRRVVLTAPHGDARRTEPHLHSRVRHPRFLGQHTVGFAGLIAAPIGIEVFDGSQPIRSRFSAHGLRQRANTYTSGFDSLEEGGQIDVLLARNDRGRLSSDIALDEVAEIGYVPNWNGQVYDLETESGTYFANSIRISNCQHGWEYAENLTDGLDGADSVWLGSDVSTSGG